MDEKPESAFDIEGKLNAGDKDSYTRLKITAEDLVKLIPDGRERIHFLLENIKVPYFDGNLKKAGDTPLTPHLLSQLKALNIGESGSVTLGNQAKFISLNIVSEQARTTSKFAVVELLQKLESLLQEIQSRSFLEEKGKTITAGEIIASLAPTSSADIHPSLKLRRFYNHIITGALEKNLSQIPPLYLSSPLPNAHDGNTPLHHALLLGYCNLAEQLIPYYQQHKLLDAPNLFKRTPLHLAALYGHYDLFKRLLTEGASLEALDEFLATPLYEACFGGSSSILEFLLNHPEQTIQQIVGEHCSQLSKDGWTPLIAAGFNHHLDIIIELLSYYQQKLGWRQEKIKEELQRRTNAGKTVLHMLVKHPDAASLVGQLATAAGYIDTHLLNELLLQVVSDSRFETINIPMLTCLSSLGAKLDCRLPEREISGVYVDDLTPLHIAASRVDKAAITFFLEKDINLKYIEDKEGRVPFDLLFKVNHLTKECYQTLLLNLSPYELITSQPLQSVPVSELLSPLWDNIRDNNLTDFSKILSSIAENELLPFLIYKPFLLPLNNKKTLTILQYLLIHCDEDMLVMVLERLKKFSPKNREKIINEPSHHQDTLLHLAIRYCKGLKVIKMLVELGANLQTKNHIDCTIIHEAACINDDDIFNYLMEQCPVREYPSYFEATNLKQWTPLLIACSCYNDKIISYLLNHSFVNDINLTNYLGQSPLYLLVKGNDAHIKNKLTLVKQLISKGALLIQTGKGYDAIAIAILSKQHEIFEQLKPLLQQEEKKETYQGSYQLTYTHLACIAGVDVQKHPSFFSEQGYYTYIPQRKRLPLNYLRSSQAELIKYHHRKIRELFIKTLTDLSDEQIQLSAYRNEEKSYFFPEGTFDFLEVHQNKLHWLDKTQIIVEFFKKPGKKTILITRPSRFGKSLVLNMLSYFFDYRHYKTLTTKLGYDPFENYKIKDHDDLVREHKGKYTVILMDFIRLAQGTYPLFLRKLKRTMKRLQEEFLYLTEDMNPTQKSEYDDIFKVRGNDDDLIDNFTSVLDELCERIYAYNQKVDPSEKKLKHKPIILIDEFDAPLLTAAISKDKEFFPRVTSTINSLLIESLKGQQKKYEIAVISGIIRASGKKLFTTLSSICDHSSMISNDLSDCFGFTQNEVLNILEERGVGKELDKLRDYYGYYYCGNEILFNPWSIIKAISSVDAKNKTLDYGDHWVAVQRDSFVFNVIQSFSTETRNVLINLMKNNIVESLLTDNLSCTHPSQQISFVRAEYKEQQKTNYRFIYNKRHKSWLFRYRDPTNEGQYYTENINQQDYPSIHALLAKADSSDIKGLNEKAKLKADLIKQLVETRQWIHLDETIWGLSLLYSAGFLTIIPFAHIQKQEQKEKQKFILMIPNREIFNFYSGALNLNYPYKPRQELIEKASEAFFTDEKIIHLLQQYTNKQDNSILALFYQCSMLSHREIPVDFISALSIRSSMAEFISELEKKRRLLKRDANILSLPETISSCIRNYFHNNRDEFPLLDQWTRGLIDNLKKNFFAKDIEAFTQDYVQKQRLYHPHVRQVMEVLFKHKSAHQFSNGFILLYSLGRYELYIHAQFESAIGYFERFIHLTSHLDDIDFQTSLRHANAYRDRGVAYFQLNFFEKASRDFDKAEQLYDSLLSREWSDAIKDNILSQKAANYLHKARYFNALSKKTEAWDAYQQAIKDYPSQAPEKTHVILEILIERFSRGEVLLQQAIADGEKLYQEVLKGTPRSSGQAQQLILAWASINYATLCRLSETDRKKQEAVALLQEAEKIIAEVFGEEHFEQVKTLTCQLGLGADHYSDWKNRYEKACRILEKSFKDKNNLLFSKLHMWVGLINHKLGYTAQARNNAKEAKRPYKNQLLNTSPTRAVLFNLETETSMMMGEVENALTANRNSLSIYKALHVNNRHYYWTALNHKGEIALLQGEFLNAESCFRDAYFGIKSHFGEHHVRTLRVYCNLVKSQFFQGFYTELYHKSEIILERIEAMHQRGYQDLRVAEIWYEYGRMYSSIGRMDFAQRFLEKATSLLSPKYVQHPTFAVYQSELMVIWACSGQFDEVVESIRTCTEIFAKHAWQDYPAYQRFLVNIAYAVYCATRCQNDASLNKLTSAMESNLSLSGPSSITCLEKAINTYKNYPLNNQNIARSYSFESKTAGAVSYYCIDTLEACLLLGKCYFQVGKLKETHQMLESLAKGFVKSLSPAQHLVVELNYYLARTYLCLSHGADINERPFFIEHSQDYFSRYKGQLCHRYSPTVIKLTELLDKEGLLGYVPLTRVRAVLKQSGKHSGLALPTEVDEQIAHYQGSLKEGFTEVTRRRRVLAQLIVLTYLSGKHELTQEYVDKYEAEGSVSHIFLQLLTLAASIPTNIQELAPMMLPSIEALCDEETRQKRLKAVMFHNLGCLYHVFAYHQEMLFCEDGAENFYEKAEHYFEKAIKLESILSPIAEYMNMLYRRSEYEKINAITIPTSDELLQSLDFQTYGYIEKPILIDTLQPLISVKNEYISVHQGVLTTYLRLRSSLKQPQNSGIEITQLFEGIKRYRQRLSDASPTSRSESISIYLLADITYRYLQTDIMYMQEASEWVRFLDQCNHVFPETHLNTLKGKICEHLPNAIFNEKNIQIKLRRVSGASFEVAKQRTKSNTPSISPKTTQSAAQKILCKNIYENIQCELNQQAGSPLASLPEERPNLQEKLSDCLNEGYLRHFCWVLKGIETDSTYQINLRLRCIQPWDHSIEWELAWELKQILDKALPQLWGQFITAVKLEGNVISIITQQQLYTYQILYRTLDTVLAMAGHLENHELTVSLLVTLLNQLKNKRLAKTQCEDAMHHFRKIASRNAEWRQFREHLMLKNKNAFVNDSEHIKILLTGYHRITRLALLEYQDYRSVLEDCQCIIDHYPNFAQYISSHRVLKFCNTLFYAAVLKGDNSLSRQFSERAEQIRMSSFSHASKSYLEDGIYCFVRGLWNENQAQWEEASQAYQQAISNFSQSSFKSRLWLVLTYYRVSTLSDHLHQDDKKSTTNVALTKAANLLESYHPREQYLVSLLIKQREFMLKYVHSPQSSEPFIPRLFELANNFIAQVGISHPVIATIYLDMSDAWLIQKQYPFALFFAQLSYRIYLEYQPNSPLPQSYQIRFWEKLFQSYCMLLSHESADKKQELMLELSKEVATLAQQYYTVANPLIEFKKVYLQLLCLLEKEAPGKSIAQTTDREYGGKVFPICNKVSKTQRPPTQSFAGNHKQLCQSLQHTSKMDVLIIGGINSGRQHLAIECCEVISRPLRWLFDCCDDSAFKSSIMALADALACRFVTTQSLMGIVNSIIQSITRYGLACQFIYLELTGSFYHQHRNVIDQFSGLRCRHSFVLTQDKAFMTNTNTFAHSFTFKEIIHTKELRLKGHFRENSPVLENEKLPIAETNIDTLPIVAFRTLQLCVFLYGHEIPLSMDDRKSIVRIVSESSTPDTPINDQLSFFVKNITDPFEMTVNGVISINEVPDHCQRWEADSKIGPACLLLWNRIDKQASLWIKYAGLSKEISLEDDSPCAVFLADIEDKILIDQDSQAELKYLIWLLYIRPKVGLRYDVLKACVNKINGKRIIRFYFSEKIVKSVSNLLCQSPERVKIVKWLIVTSLTLLKEKWSQNKNAWFNNEQTRVLLSVTELLYKRMCDQTWLPSLKHWENEFAWISLSLGKAYYRCHHYAKALGYFKMGWQYNSTILPQYMSDDQRSLFMNYCVASGFSGECNKARIKLQNLLEILKPQDPLYFNAYNHLVSFHWGLGETDEALRYCERIREAAPSESISIGLYHNYARTHRYLADKCSSKEEKLSHFKLANSYLDKILVTIDKAKESSYRLLALQLEKSILHSVVGNMHQYKASMDEMIISLDRLLSQRSHSHKHENNFLLADIYQHAYIATAFLAFNPGARQNDIYSADILSRKVINLALVSYKEFLLPKQQEEAEQDILKTEDLIDDYKRHLNYHQIIYRVHSCIYSESHPNTYRMRQILEHFQKLLQQPSIFIPSRGELKESEMNSASTPNLRSLVTQKDSEVIQSHWDWMLGRYNPVEQQETYKLINQVIETHNHYFQEHYRLAVLPLGPRLKGYVPIDELISQMKPVSSFHSITQNQPTVGHVEETALMSPSFENHAKRNTISVDIDMESYPSYPGFFGEMDEMTPSEVSTPIVTINAQGTDGNSALVPRSSPDLSLESHANTHSMFFSSRKPYRVSPSEVPFSQKTSPTSVLSLTTQKMPLIEHKAVLSPSSHVITTPSSKDSYEQTVLFLKEFKSNTLADTQAMDNEILRFIKFKLKKIGNVVVANQSWKLRVEDEGDLYFKNMTFPLIDFFIEFLADEEKTAFLLPLMPNSSHHCGLIILKETSDEKISLKYHYINPETGASENSAVDAFVFDKIKKIDQIIFELIGEISAIKEEESYFFKHADVSNELPSNKVKAIKEINRETLSFKNHSCKQQKNNRDCGYIVGQTLYEFATQQPFSIPSFHSGNIIASIKAIAKARTNFGTEEIVGKDQTDVYIKRQYYDRLAKAMFGIGDNKEELCQYIKNLHIQKKTDNEINSVLIDELSQFIEIRNFKIEEYKKLEGDFDDDKLFNFLMNSKEIFKVSAEEIRKTCENLLECKIIDVNTTQNVYYVLKSDRKAKRGPAIFAFLSNTRPGPSDPEQLNCVLSTMENTLSYLQSKQMSGKELNELEKRDLSELPSRIQHIRDKLELQNRVLPVKEFDI